MTNKFINLSITFLFCSLIALPVFAQKTFQPGEYIGEEGYGALEIQPQKNGAQLFNINSVSGTGNICDISGSIKNGKAIVQDDKTEPRCIVNFSLKGEDIDVSYEQTYEACQHYCGMNATFSGLYPKTAPECGNKQKAKTRALFKSQYDKKDYQQAKATLLPILNNCKRTLSRNETGRLLNDLALTQYKMGDAAACRQTLKPLAKDAARTDEDLSDDPEYPLQVLELDEYLKVMKATRTNLKLCK